MSDREIEKLENDLIYKKLSVEDMKEKIKWIKHLVRQKAINDCKNAQCLGYHYTTDEFEWDVPAVKRIEEKVEFKLNED